MFARRRFRDVVARQLDLFERDYPDEVAETRTRLAAYNAADRDDAEELYGDYMDQVDAVREMLEDVRDTYARTLPEESRDDYEREFDRLLAKRSPRVGL
jgi:isocitrate dehydrogenase kinase/phosphatase